MEFFLDEIMYSQTTARNTDNVKFVKFINFRVQQNGDTKIFNQQAYEPRYFDTSNATLRSQLRSDAGHHCVSSTTPTTQSSF
jgi:hypothetical protein